MVETIKRKQEGNTEILMWLWDVLTGEGDDEPASLRESTELEKIRMISNRVMMILVVIFFLCFILGKANRKTLKKLSIALVLCKIMAIIYTWKLRIRSC